MTYFLTTPKGAVKRYRGQPAAMGGWLDAVVDFATGGKAEMIRDYLSTDNSIECINEANQNASIKQIDDYVYNLSKTWTPTGYYSPNEIITTVGVIQGYMLATMTDVQLSPNPHSVSDRDTTIRQAVSNLQGYIAKGQAFTDAARQTTDLVNAPGFKRWVMYSLQAMSQAMTVRAVLECNVDFLDKLMGFFGAIWDVLKAIGHLVVQAGQAVFKIPDFLDQVWTVAKWTALLGGGAWIAFKLREASRGGR